MELFIETPTAGEVARKCNEVRLVLLSFLLKDDPKKIIEKIDEKSEIYKLICKTDLVLLSYNKDWKTILKLCEKLSPFKNKERAEKLKYLMELLPIRLN